jgi:voltage-gated potassium channel
VYQYSNYDLFILVISVLSLFVMALYYLPGIGQTETAVAFALDTVFSFIFLYDFFRSLKRAADRWGYFKQSGWLDLLGSLPTVTFLRIFRIARLIRIIRTMRRIEFEEVWRVYKENRAESTFYTTLIIVILLLTFTSLTIVQIESASPEAQITTSSDALWWSLVTTTTVGYGDLVPTTDTGRLLATLLMTLGVALVSVLTSYVTTSLILRGDPEEEERRERLEEKLDRLLSEIDQSDR